MRVNARNFARISETSSPLPPLPPPQRKKTLGEVYVVAVVYLVSKLYSDNSDVLTFLVTVQLRFPRRLPLQQTPDQSLHYSLHGEVATALVLVDWFAWSGVLVFHIHFPYSGIISRVRLGQFTELAVTSHLV